MRYVSDYSIKIVNSSSEVYDITRYVDKYRFQSGPDQPIRYLEMQVDKISIDKAHPGLIDSIVEGRTQLLIDAVGQGTFIITKIWLDDYKYEFVANGMEYVLNTAETTVLRTGKSVQIAKSIAEAVGLTTYFSPSFYSNGVLTSVNTMTINEGMSAILALQLCALSDGAFVFFGEHDSDSDCMYYVKYGDDVPIASNPGSQSDGVINVYPSLKSSETVYSENDLYMYQHTIDLSSKSPEGSSTIVNMQRLSYTDSDTGKTEITDESISQESIDTYGEHSGGILDATEMVCSSAVAKKIVDNLVKRYKDPSQSIVIGMQENGSDSTGIYWDMSFSCYAYAKSINDEVNDIHIANKHVCDGTYDDFLLRVSLFTRSYPENYSYYTFGVAKQTTLSQELATLSKRKSSVSGGSGESIILYNTTGQNTDGAMTQKATTNALNEKQPVGDYATNTALTNGLAGKVDKLSTSPAGNGYVKVNVNEQGQVTGHSSMVEGDIPTLSISKITNLQSSLDGKIKRGSYERIEGTSSAHKDLNNYRTAGFYNVKGQYVDNCPLTGTYDYYLLVMPWNTGGWCVQICVTGNYTTANYNTIWVRSSTNTEGTTWSAWNRMASQDKVVLIEGAQTISGAKTFTSRTTFDYYNPVLKLDTGHNIGFNIQLNVDEYNVTPSADKIYAHVITDKNNIEEARLQFFHGTSGAKAWRMSGKKNDGTEVYSDLLRILSDGTAYMTGPHRSYSSASNDDVLVKSHVADMPVVHLTGNETIAGEKTFDDDTVFNGDIIQNGSAYETHAEKIFTKNDFIILRDGAISGLPTGQYSGLQFKKYDGTNDGRLVVDNSGTARVGDVGYEQPLLTRAESNLMTNGQALKWDGTNLKAVTSGYVLGDACAKGVDSAPTYGSNNVVTSNGLYDALSKKINKSGDSMTGAFLISRTGATARQLYLKSNTIETGVTPSSDCYQTIEFIDKNGSVANLTRLGEIGQAYKKDGSNAIYLRTYNKDGSDFEELKLVGYSDGTFSLISGADVVVGSIKLKQSDGSIEMSNDTSNLWRLDISNGAFRTVYNGSSVPFSVDSSGASTSTPSAGEKSTRIATTSWVKTVADVCMIYCSNNGVDGYVKIYIHNSSSSSAFLGKYLLINFYSSSVNADSSATFTWKKPFADKYYGVLVNCMPSSTQAYNNASCGPCWAVQDGSKTATSCTIQNDTWQGSVQAIAIGYCYS